MDKFERSLSTTTKVVVGIQWATTTTVVVGIERVTTTTVVVGIKWVKKCNRVNHPRLTELNSGARAPFMIWVILVRHDENFFAVSESANIFFASIPNSSPTTIGRLSLAMNIANAISADVTLSILQPAATNLLMLPKRD